MEGCQTRFQRIRVVVLALHKRLAGHIVHARRARRRKLLVVRAPAGRVDPAPCYALHLCEAELVLLQELDQLQRKKASVSPGLQLPCISKVRGC